MASIEMYWKCVRVIKSLTNWRQEEATKKYLKLAEPQLNFMDVYMLDSMLARKREELLMNL